MVPELLLEVVVVAGFDDAGTTAVRVLTCRNVREVALGPEVTRALRRMQVAGHYTVGATGARELPTASSDMRGNT